MSLASSRYTTYITLVLTPHVTFLRTLTFTFFKYLGTHDKTRKKPLMKRYRLNLKQKTSSHGHAQRLRQAKFGTSPLPLTPIAYRHTIVPGRQVYSVLFPVIPARASWWLAFRGDATEAAAEPD